jgi:hypothetical protein
MVQKVYTHFSLQFPYRKDVYKQIKQTLNIGKKEFAN